MRRHFTQKDIKKIFTDPLSLKKGQKLWKDAEKKGEKFIKEIKHERGKILERTT
jgi:hypothetical protein